MLSTKFIQTSIIFAAPVALSLSLLGCRSDVDDDDTASVENTTTNTTASTAEPAPETSDEAQNQTAESSPAQPTRQAGNADNASAGQGLTTNDSNSQTTRRPGVRQNQRSRPDLPAADEVVKFNTETIDFGRIPITVPTETTLKLTNISDEPITITNAKASCGCTTPNWPRDPIAAGETVEIPVGLKTPSKPGPLLNKTVRFMFDKASQVVIPLKADIFAYVTIDPDIISAPTDTNVAEMEDEEIVIKSTDGESFHIKEVNPPFVTDVPEEASTEHVVKLDWSKWDEAGGGFKKVEFLLDHPKAERVSAIIKAAYRNRNRDRISRARKQPLGRNGVIQAVRSGNMDQLSKALKGASERDINAADQSGRTPLLWAASENNPELINALVDAGAKLTIPDKAGMTPLILAAKDGSTDAVKTLLDAGAEVNATDRTGGTALVWAAGFGKPSSVKVLLDAGAKLEVVNVTGMTPLMSAAGYGEPESTQLLIDAGANLNESDQMAKTPLIYATGISKDPKTVKMLIDAGADLEAKTRSGRTALIIAAAKSRLNIVEMLVDAGANLNATDVADRTALDHARNRTDDNREAIVAYLENKSGSQKTKQADAGESINKSTDQGG